MIDSNPWLGRVALGPRPEPDSHQESNGLVFHIDDLHWPRISNFRLEGDIVHAHETLYSQGHGALVAVV